MNKRVTWTITYNIDRDETEKYISEEVTFDVNGNTLDHTHFDRYGRAENRMVFRYSDVSGNLLERVEYDFINGLIERKEFFEDADGEVYKAVITYNDGSTETREYSFSDLGKADRATIRDNTGEQTGEEIFAYDDDDNLIIEIEKDAGGKEVLRIEREFVPGPLLKAERTFVNGELKDSVTFGYNAYGSPAIRIKKDRSGAVIESEVRSYNDQNIIIEKRLETSTRSGKVVEQSTYDDSGNMLLMEIHRGGHLTFRNECAYDDDHRLLREELLEVTTHGKVVRHERLEHHYEGEPAPRRQREPGSDETYGEW